MKVGTKSILYGVHAFWLHPIMVAIAWIKLFGFPFSIPIWTSFFVHDLGYWGKPNMDGKEGETHVELGANIMHRLFDKKYKPLKKGKSSHIGRFITPINSFEWYDFTLYHSRFYAKTNNRPISKLCIADKYAFVFVLNGYTYLWLDGVVRYMNIWMKIKIEVVIHIKEKMIGLNM